MPPASNSACARPVDSASGSGNDSGSDSTSDGDTDNDSDSDSDSESARESEGDTASAVKYQRQWAQAAPNNHDAQLGLAQLLVKAGEAEEAAAIWAKLVADEPQPHRNLQAIDALMTHGKANTVAAITRRLLGQNPANWELLYREGIALADLQRPDEAAQRFQAILDLRQEEKEVFLLRQNGNLTYEQIAEIRSSPVGTVKTQMRAALQKLRKVLH